MQRHPHRQPVGSAQAEQAAAARATPRPLRFSLVRESADRNCRRVGRVATKFTKEPIGTSNGVELFDGQLNVVLIATVAVDVRHEQSGNAQRLPAFDARLAVLEAKIEREVCVAPQRKSGFCKVPAPHRDRAQLTGAYASHDAFGVAVNDEIREVDNRAGEYSDTNAGRGAADDGRTQNTQPAAGQPHLALSPSAELISVAPGRVFRAEWLADPDQFRVIAQTGEPDVLRGYALLRVSKESFGLLDRFPAVFERCQVPAFTLATHHPQPAFTRIERKPVSNRKRLQRLVASEFRVAEETGRVHGL